MDGRQLPGSRKILISQSHKASMPQLLSSALWSPGSPTREGNCNEKTCTRAGAWALPAATREKPHVATKTQHSRRKRVNISKFKRWRHCWNNISIFKKHTWRGLTLQKPGQNKEATATERPVAQLENCRKIRRSWYPLIFQSLYRLCYNSASVSCFGFFGPRGTWDLLPNQVRTVRLHGKPEAQPRATGAVPGCCERCETPACSEMSPSALQKPWIPSAIKAISIYRKCGKPQNSLCFKSQSYTPARIPLEKRRK